MKFVLALLFAAALASPAAAAPSFADDLRQCKEGATPKERAEGCAAAIEWGELQGDALAAAFSQYGLALFDSGEHVRALAAVTEAMRINPLASRYTWLRGLMHYQLQDCAQAQPDFDRALALGDTQAQTYFYRGSCYEKEGAARALVDFETAIRLAPEMPDAYFGRAAALAQLGRTAEALASADAGVAIAPDKPQSYVARAGIHIALENTTLAKADLAQALTLDSEFVPALSGLADLTYKDGQVDAALGYYDRIVKAEPENSGALNNRCYLLAEIGRLDEALKDCEASIAITANEINLDSRGFVHLKRGDFTAALADFDAALVKDAKLPSSLYGRGIARIRLGQTAEGQADLAAATALDAEIAAFYDKNGLKP